MGKGQVCRHAHQRRHAHTVAFYRYIYHQAELRLFKGRVRFINPKEPGKSAPSPKPSMVVVFWGQKPAQQVATADYERAAHPAAAQ